MLNVIGCGVVITLISYVYLRDCTANLTKYAVINSLVHTV